MAKLTVIEGAEWYEVIRVSDDDIIRGCIGRYYDKKLAEFKARNNGGEVQLRRGTALRDWSNSGCDYVLEYGKVIDRSEFTSEEEEVRNELRQRALSKLTEEERKALGL